MLPFDIRHIVVCHVQKKLFTIKNSPVFFWPTLYLFVIYYVIAVNVSLLSHTSNARFYELGLTHDSRVIPGLTVVSVLSTSNLGLNWD